MASIYYELNIKRLPRKLKKRVLGRKLNKSKIRKLLSNVQVYHDVDGNSMISPFEFCPNCGCRHYYGTGNLEDYPSWYEFFYCYRCDKKVGIIDNSPFRHVLEFKEQGYNIKVL